MNVVDSSAWLEYFADGPNADFFAPPVEDLERLVVPVVTLYEVFKRVCAQRGEEDAFRAVAQMQQGLVVPLDGPLALEGARVSLLHRLSMADSLILATAQHHEALLWTQDGDFEGLPGVRYRARAVAG